jgi:hypothetical protein
MNATLSVKEIGRIEIELMAKAITEYLKNVRQS